MIQILKILLLTALTSLFYFPIEFTQLQGINTKMVYACIGIVIMVCSLVKRRCVAYVDRKIIIIYLIALFFSLWCYFSTTYNKTNDYVYATYFVSMSVWLMGAFTVLTAIKFVDGYVDMYQVFKYVGFVCLAQCILALMIDNMPELCQFIDRYVQQDQEFLHETKRLYGIGASFDTAGIRFSCALLGVAYLISHPKSEVKKYIYWMIFVTISIIGNIISRTTTVGIAIGLIYMWFHDFSYTAVINIPKFRSRIAIFIILLALLSVTIYYYNTNTIFNTYLRYGFEGFFNFIERGEWETSSTNRLQTMMRWPNNTKTWILGDGYFNDPNGRGFYMFTDIGYLRLIYYCGLVGLSIFTFFFVVCTSILCGENSREKFLFILLLCVNMIVWIKISTDVFTIFDVV